MPDRSQRKRWAGMGSRPGRALGAAQRRRRGAPELLQCRLHLLPPSRRRGPREPGWRRRAGSGAGVSSISIRPTGSAGCHCKKGADQAEQLGGTAQRVADEGFTLLRIEQHPDALGCAGRGVRPVRGRARRRGRVLRRGAPPAPQAAARTGGGRWSSGAGTQAVSRSGSSPRARSAAARPSRPSCDSSRRGRSGRRSASAGRAAPAGPPARAPGPARRLVAEPGKPGAARL